MGNLESKESEAIPADDEISTGNGKSGDSDETVETYFCDGINCKKQEVREAIEGDRYKCNTCEDVNFCSECEASPGNHDISHPLLKFKAKPRNLELSKIGIEYEKEEKWYVKDKNFYTKPIAVKEEPRKWLFRFRLNKKKPSLTIESPHIIKILQTAIPYWPGLALDGGPMKMHWPFPELYHYWTEICMEGEKVHDDETKQDLELVKHFYDEVIRPLHDKVRSDVSRNMISFEAVWALFKPGDLVVSKDSLGEPCIFRSTSILQKSDLSLFAIMWDTKRDEDKIAWTIDAWNTAWDGSSQKFYRKVSTQKIEYYPGVAQAETLATYPVRYHHGYQKDPERFLSMCEKRGRQWMEYVSNKPVCREHDGPVFISSNKPGNDETRRNHIGRVIVDHDGFDIYGQELDSTPAAGSNITDGPFAEIFNPKHKGRALALGGVDEYEHPEFDDVRNVSEASAIQAQLCPSVIRIFTLSTRGWYDASVMNLREVGWAREAFDHLVMDERSKAMVKALIEQHHMEDSRSVTDVIAGKGRGLVIVLHGPPGVGKTLTAESVAEYTKKPLLPVNVGELTIDQHLEKNLVRIFQQANSWGAVLLLDEADVLLERRSYEDVRRNSVVSVFLRLLEYYEGILAMTTNRIETMDAAFQSRIHMAVRFHDLDSKLRSLIWRKFIDRMAPEDQDAKVELLKSIDELAEYPLNGRQIYNTLNIAQSLARNRGYGRGRERLSFQALEDIIQHTLDFQHFFEDAKTAKKSQLITATGFPARNSTFPNRR